MRRAAKRLLQRRYGVPVFARLALLLLSLLLAAHALYLLGASATAACLLMLATSLVLCAAVWMAVAEQEYEAFAFGAEAGADSSRCRFRCSIVLTVRADTAHKPYAWTVTVRLVHISYADVNYHSVANLQNGCDLFDLIQTSYMIL